MNRGAILRDDYIDLFEAMFIQKFIWNKIMRELIDFFNRLWGKTKRCLRFFSLERQSLSKHGFLPEPQSLLEALNEVIVPSKIIVYIYMVVSIRVTESNERRVSTRWKISNEMTAQWIALESRAKRTFISWTCFLLLNFFSFPKRQIILFHKILSSIRGE